MERAQQLLGELGTKHPLVTAAFLWGAMFASVGAWTAWIDPWLFEGAATGSSGGLLKLGGVLTALGAIGLAISHLTAQWREERRQHRKLVNTLLGAHEEELELHPGPDR